MQLTEHQEEKIARKIHDAIHSHTENELAKGLLMYNYVRTLKSREFSELCARNLKGERFDDMILEAIARPKPAKIAEGYNPLGLTEDQVGTKNGWRLLALEEYLPPKPKTLTPWTLATVPKCHLLVRQKGRAAFYSVLDWTPSGLRFGPEYREWQYLLDNQFEHSIDGGKTWLPCGIYES